MIAFGCSIGDAEAYRRFAASGITRVREDDSEILAFNGIHPAGRSLNLVLDAAAQLPDLEALVLLAPTVELTDPGFCARVRELFSDPELGAAGFAGASDVRTIAWWEGDVAAAGVRQHYYEHGEGEIDAYGFIPHRRAPADVQALDGQLLVLSPWVVEHLRFDESLMLGFGVELDFCLRIGDAGRRLVVAELPAIVHRSLEMVGELDLWIEAHIQFAQRWADVLTPTEGEAAWRQRARRAEAEREAARAAAFSHELNLDAHIERLERELAEKTGSLAWRITLPLRKGNELRRLAGRRRGPALARR